MAPVSDVRSRIMTHRRTDRHKARHNHNQVLVCLEYVIIPQCLRRGQDGIATAGAQAKTTQESKLECRRLKLPGDRPFHSKPFRMPTHSTCCLFIGFPQVLLSPSIFKTKKFSGLSIQNSIHFLIPPLRRLFHHGSMKVVPDHHLLVASPMSFTSSCHIFQMSTMHFYKLFQEPILDLYE